MSVPRDIVEAFSWQAAFCDAFGSAFTAELLRRAATDLADGGIVARLTAQWRDQPVRDATSLRLAGALHAATLTGRDPKLAAQWPAARPDWDMDAAWAAALDFLNRHEDWVAGFIMSPPQTNEVRRSVALFAGLQSLAAGWDGPIDLLELGASAGLNGLFPDHSYACGSWQWQGNTGVVLDTDWTGTAPPLKPLKVRSLAQCDINPLDPANPDDRLRLRAYVWADQTDRLARLDAAMDAAVARSIKPDAADAAQWVAERLFQRATGGLTVVYHSIFYQYPPEDVRQAIRQTIEAAGALATETAPLAWLRFEPGQALEGEANPNVIVVDARIWPGDRRMLLSDNACPHGRFVHWLGIAP